MASAASAADPVLQTRPQLGVHWGDHRLALSFTTRARVEFWDAHAEDSDTFYALRTRIGARYDWKERFSFYAELQDARIWSLAPGTSGTGALYRGFAAGRDRSRTHHDRLRALWAEWRPTPELALRVGRQDLALGAVVTAPEPYWGTLIRTRMGQRLGGGVGFSHGARAFDGVSLTWDQRDHHLLLFAARPTTGVFDIEDAYRHVSDVTLAGGSWTLKRDRFLQFSELELFGLYYDDDRARHDGGRAGDVEIVTLGLRALAVLPLENGRVDASMWLAYQLGDFTGPGPAAREQPHRAFALAFEAGHQWRKLWGEPWLRVGVVLASGDGRPGRGRHRTFFNVLPTNHLYYGIADRAALQNLFDTFVQLRWSPFWVCTVDLKVHLLRLHRDADARYQGTGLTGLGAFGYAAQPSRGYGGIGTEIDLVARWRVSRHLTFETGYAHLFGRGVLNAFDDPDVRFGYVQATLRY